MKTRNFPSLIFLVLTFGMASPASAAVVPVRREVRIDMERLAELPAADQQRVLEIRDRLEALIATDRSTLDTEHRLALRREWKELKSEMKYYNHSGGGDVIYISTGALIIIILLLIILL